MEEMPEFEGDKTKYVDLSDEDLVQVEKLAKQIEKKENVDRSAAWDIALISFRSARKEAKKKKRYPGGRY
jgi:hypothetical protein